MGATRLGKQAGALLPTQFIEVLFPVPRRVFIMGEENR